MKKFIHLAICFITPCIILSLILFLIFSPIFYAESLIFPYALTPFDICKTYPKIWNLIKNLYFVSFILCYSIVYISLYNNIRKIKYTKDIPEEIEIIDNSKLALKIGQTETGSIKYIHENRTISKHYNNWHYWKWKDLFCYVSFYKTTCFILLQ